ncbi:MAG: hypothetical protein RI564_05595 [Gracilimonas sp.]|nr:hypothetical protein [Gracilimonas sp.]
MQSKSLISALVFLMIPFIGMGQWYNSSVINRPGGLNWQELKTDHFRIIFPEGADSIAYISAAILESQYAKASALTGGTLKNFPVILRDYNDLSNGFVTSSNFRSEVDIAALKGKSMNPQTGNWLETVLPHELIHAAHFNVQQPLNEKKVSFSNAISLFSPDLARSIHGFPPVGIHEGLAVYHESKAITPMGGRGNYTHFTNRFNANFGSSDRWNMGQTLIPSDYSRPLGRHYISGYQFVDWLQEEYGEDISRKAIRYHYHNFFLGYGFALRQKTGKWPWELYEAYEKANRQKEHERLAKIQGETTDKSTILDFHFKGEEAHSPKWINHEELLFYTSFYNGRLGFYRMDLKDEQPSLLIETFSVNDFNYEIENHSKLYFSSYKRDPLYPSTFKTDLFTYDFNTAKRERLTYDSRIYAPTTNGQVLLGIKIEGGNAEIVQVDEKSGESSIIKQFGESTPKALRFNPKNPEQLAVVLQKRGVQALWITTLQTMEQDLEKEPDVAFSKGSIFDPEWHPDGTKVLFTMDAQPAMNIFEYDLISGEILQLTSSAYNAMEASYSPDGSKIAYVLQVDDERKIALLDRDHFFNKPVNKESLWSGQELSKALNRPLLGYDSLDSIKTISPTPYKSNINWLTPRSVFPVVEEKGGTYQYGAAVSSIDALSSQAYTLQLTGIQDRLWYDFTYTNKMFYPGFECI